MHSLFWSSPLGRLVMGLGVFTFAFWALAGAALFAWSPGRGVAMAAVSRLGSHPVHALHTPYWWLRCLVGPQEDSNPLVKAYHRLLVWDMVKAPLVTRLAERLLQPVLGKSLVLYARKPTVAVVESRPVPASMEDHARVA